MKSECGIEYEEITKDNVKVYRLNNGVELDHIPNESDIKTNNLKPYYSMTEKERKERIQKMTENSVKARKERKTMKESLEKFLELKANRNLIRESLTDEIVNMIPKDAEITLNDLVVLKAIASAIDGSERYSVFVRDTVGEKPTDKAEIQAEVITESDRMLIEKLAKRLESSPE